MAVGRIGIDIGRVIIDREANEQADKSGNKRWHDNPNYLQTPPIEGAIEGIARLSREYFGQNIWLVSKCGVRVERQTREWLAHIRFCEQTGVPPLNIWFCRQRRDKAEIARELGLTHFVDDRMEVLGYLAEFVPGLYLFNAQQEEVTRFQWRATRENLQYPLGMHTKFSQLVNQILDL